MSATLKNPYPPGTVGHKHFEHLAISFSNYELTCRQCAGVVDVFFYGEDHGKVRQFRSLPCEPRHKMAGPICRKCLYGFRGQVHRQGLPPEKDPTGDVDLPEAIIVKELLKSVPKADAPRTTPSAADEAAFRAFNERMEAAAVAYVDRMVSSGALD